jgi:hypothetical protein
MLSALEGVENQSLFLRDVLINRARRGRFRLLRAGRVPAPSQRRDLRPGGVLLCSNGIRAISIASSSRATRRQWSHFLATVCTVEWNEDRMPGVFVSLPMATEALIARDIAEQARADRGNMGHALDEMFPSRSKATVTLPCGELKDQGIRICDLELVVGNVPPDAEYASSS